MKTVIQTPEGPRTIPDWAKCHCVTTHRPNYIHPYPFALPDGTELWLCPNTYHQATTLRNIYHAKNGPPKSQRVGTQFNYFVRSLLTMYWQQILNDRSAAETLKEWRKTQPDYEKDIFDMIKELEADTYE